MLSGFGLPYLVPAAGGAPAILDIFREVDFAPFMAVDVQCPDRFPGNLVNDPRYQMVVPSLVRIARSCVTEGLRPGAPEGEQADRLGIDIRRSSRLPVHGAAGVIDDDLHVIRPRPACGRS